MSDTRRSLNSLEDIKFAVTRIEELEAKLTMALDKLVNMRDDQVGYRHVSHFRRGAAVAILDLKRKTV